MNPHTVRDFEYSGDVRPIVDSWVAENGFRLIEETGPARVLQRGHGFWTAPVRLQISQEGSRIHLETWIPVNFFVRLMALFVLPKQMGVESGGFRGVLPRKIGREKANKLLTALGQPAIS